MIRRTILDIGPLGRIAHPRPNQEIASWLTRLLESGAQIIIPEIADYKLRRNLPLKGFSDSIRRLDQLKEVPTYMPLSTEVMLKEAQFWAEARKRGKATAAAHQLVGDAILAAQASVSGAMVATENVAHLDLFVEAEHWREIEPNSV